MLHSMKFDVDTPEDLMEFLRAAEVNPIRGFKFDTIPKSRDVYNDVDANLYDGSLGSFG